MSDVEHHAYDVVIVGAGGAGLRAAIESSAAGARTAVICKSLLGKAHTVMAEGGAAAALGNVDERDSWKTHFRDTMKGGNYLGDWRMAEIHAKLAPERILELEQWGAVFDRTGSGAINQRNFGGHSYPRLAHIGDATGLELIRTLQEQGIHSGIGVYMEHTVTRLLTAEGGMAGCLAYDRATGDLHVFQAPSVVLATGGITRCWEVSSGSWEYTGDGHALALWAGAELMDMEFVQFHPTGMIWPKSVKGILVTEGVRGEGGVLQNSEGHRFMFENIPPMYDGEYAETEEEARAWLDDVISKGTTDHRPPPELLKRDVVARAINKEVREGRGSPHGGVFLNIHSQRTPDEIKRKLPSMEHQFRELAGVDITSEPMEVGPTAHYVMGGVRVDSETQESSIPGLYAAGEVASGLHGANRLGGNSLSDLIVFGKLAGEHAAKRALDGSRRRDPPPDLVLEAVMATLEPLEREASGESETPGDVYHAIRGMMQQKVGIIRSEDLLDEAIAEFPSFAERIERAVPGGGRAYNPGWHQCLDLRSMVDVSAACALAARERQESRGAHTRADHLVADPEYWGKHNIVIWMKDGEIKLRHESVPEPPAELAKLLEV